MSGPGADGAATVGDLLGRCLRAAGATRAFRAAGPDVLSVPGLPVVDVPDPAVAALLADADGRLSRAPTAGPGVALLPGGRLRLSAQPHEVVLAVPVTDPELLPLAVAGWAVGEGPGAVELDLDLDLGAPAPPDLEPLTVGAADDRLLALSPTMATLDTVILVGPGVVRDGQVDGVAEAARMTGARVVATAGALGVLPVDHPAWRGVVGLQAGDATLAGLEGAELVVVAGLDEHEARGAIPPGAQVLEVQPWHLALMAMRWPEPGAPAPERGARLVRGVGRLAAEGRAADGVPLHPGRVVADLAEVLDPDELVLADPGPAGLWLVRGLVARAAGSVVVPARPGAGFAAAGALVAGLDGRRAVAVLADPVDPLTDAVLDLAAALDVGVVCEVWAPGAEEGWSSAAEHRARLVGARHEGGVQRLTVPVDLAATSELLELAGPVVAWAADDLDALDGGGDVTPW